MFALLQQYMSQLLTAAQNALTMLRDALTGGEDDASTADSGTPPPGLLIGSVTDGNGLVIHVYADETDAGLNMTVKVMEGVADLRGFYMDVGDSVEGVSVEGVADSDLKIGDESVTTVGSRDNNMNGTGETFDVGMEIGTAGYMRDDHSETSFTLQGVGLEDLDGLTFGVRATSVGEDRTDAVKLLGEFDVPAEEPPAAEPALEQPGAETPTEVPAETPVPTPSIGGSFPQLTDNITSIVLYYDTPAGDGNGDGYYATQVENVSWIVEDDLDLWLGDVTSFLEMSDPNIDADTGLVGVAITHGTDGTTEYYAMDGDPGVDAAPSTYVSPDATINYDTIMG